MTLTDEEISRYAEKQTQRWKEIKQFIGSPKAEEKYRRHVSKTQRIPQTPFTNERIEQVVQYGNKIQNLVEKSKLSQSIYNLDEGRFDEDLFSELKRISQKSGKSIEEKWAERLKDISDRYDEGARKLLVHKGYQEFQEKYKLYDEGKARRDQLTRVAGLCKRLGESKKETPRDKNWHHINDYLEFNSQAEEIQESLESLTDRYYHEDIQDKQDIRNFLQRAEESKKELEQLEQKYQPSLVEKMHRGFFLDHKAFTHPETKEKAKGLLHELHHDLNNYQELQEQREKVIEEKQRLEHAVKNFDRYFSKNISEITTTSKVSELERLTQDDVEGEKFQNKRDEVRKLRQILESKYEKRKDKVTTCARRDLNEIKNLLDSSPDDIQEVTDYVTRLDDVERNLEDITQALTLLGEEDVAESSENLLKRARENRDKYRNVIGKYQEIKSAHLGLEGKTPREINPERFREELENPYLTDLAASFEEKASKKRNNAEVDDSFLLTDYVQNLPSSPTTEHVSLKNALMGEHDETYEGRLNRFLHELRTLDSPQSPREREFVGGLGRGVEKLENSGALAHVLTPDMQQTLNEIYSEVDDYTSN